MTENTKTVDKMMTGVQAESFAALERARERARHQNPHDQPTPTAATTPDGDGSSSHRASVPPLESVMVDGRKILPEWRIDIHVYCIVEHLGVDVHLGEDFQGQWYPHVVGTPSGCPEMDVDDVVAFLTGEEALAEPMIDDHDEAVRLLTATRDRCLRLAVAQANLKLGGSVGEAT